MKHKRLKDDDFITDIYSDAAEDLRKKGIYYITGVIDENSLLNIHQDVLLKHLDPDWNDDIQLIINTVGGSCSEGWALIDLLDYVKMDVKTIGMGEVCSLGSVLLASGTKGKRIAAKNLSVMIHGAWTDYMSGNKQQLISQMKWLEEEYKRDQKFWMEHSKYTTAKQIEKHFLNGFDQYMSAEKALEHGIVDFIQSNNKTNT